MEYSTNIVGEKGYIKIEGELESEQSGEALRKAFNDLLNRGERTVVLDLSKVQYISSHGISNVLRCYKRLRAENGTLMVKPLKGPVKETFEILMLDKVLPVEQ